MILKAFLFASIFCLAYCVNLEFEEGGRKYNETVTFTRDGSVVYNVPRHGSIGAAEFFVHYLTGYSILKDNVARLCYAMKITNEEPTTIQVKIALKRMNGKFPNRHIIETYSMLPLHRIDPHSMARSIQRFCGHYPIIKVISAKSIIDIEEEALKILLRILRSGTNKRDVIQEFPACNMADFMTTFTKCGTNPDKMIIHCKYLGARKCVFKVRCDPNGSGGWNCPPDHVFNSLVCCDTKCKE